MKDDYTTKKQIIDGMTELHLQNAALKESESADKYRVLVENIKDVIYELDSQGVVLYISPAVRDMLGFDSAEIIGKNLTALAHEDDLSRLEEWFSELREGRESPSEYRVRDKSGQLRWAQTRVRPVMKDGQFRGARGILIDVTEQKHAEERLRKSEEKYRSVFQNSIMGISQTLRDGRLIAVNSAYAKMYGYANAEEMMTEVPSAWQLYANPEEREDVLRILTEKGVMEPREINVIRRDGTQFTVLAGTREIRDSEGNPLYYQVEQIDITERKQAEDALRKSEHKYHLIVDNMADVITVMDMNLRFTYVSPSIMRMRGYTPEEAMAQPLEQVMTPESLQIIVKALEEELALEAGGTADPDRIRIVELKEYRKDGSTVWSEDHLSFMRDAAKKAVSIISVSHDITERKEAEHKVKKQTDAMEAAIDGIAILNKDQEYTYLNHAHVRIYGYENVMELIGKSWRTLYDADEIKRFDAEIMPEFGQTGYWQGEARGMKKDGSTFPQEISLTALDDGGLICIVRDITDRKLTEELLRDSRELLSNALEMAHLGHWEYDVANDLFTFNDQFYKIFRTTAEQVGGYTMSSAEYAHRFVHPDDVYLVMEETRKAIETTDIHFNRQIEHRMLYADGSVGYATVRFFIVKDSDGRTVKTYGVNQDITELKRAQEELRRTLENLKKAFTSSIQLLVSAVEAKDPYTSGHQKRSAHLATAIATELGLSRERIEILHMAASIHDIGKLSIPAEILSKPSRLTNIEFSLIKEHPGIGYELLKGADFPWPLAEIVYQHHERMDGSGYPRNLKGDEIVLEARIMAVADVVESMASHRPYRPALGIDAALEEIERNKGTLYDDSVADACLRLFREKGYQLQESSF